MRDAIIEKIEKYLGHGLTHSQSMDILDFIDKFSDGDEK